MPRLIDADELVRTTDELSEGAGFYKPIYEGFSRAVKNQPTIDAVPVVRCKDCKHFINLEPCDPCECMKWTVKWGRVYVEPNDFCSYGERKDGEG